MVEGYLQWWFLQPPPSLIRVNGKKYILTIKDLFTGWVEFFPVSDTKTGPVIKILAEELFVRYGVPFEILTDNATSFISKEFKKFCQDLGITLKHSSPHNPKENFAENANFHEITPTNENTQK